MQQYHKDLFQIIEITSLKQPQQLKFIVHVARKVNTDINKPLIFQVTIKKKNNGLKLLLERVLKVNCLRNLIS